MKLQKFIKNKRQKRIVIASIIGVIVIIGGISLYKTFALYKEMKTFNVLSGTVPFFCKENLNGAEPVITGDLVPVAIGDDGTVTKVRKDSKDWYNYCDKKWANAVVLTSDVKAQNIQDGNTIEEKYIESYFVWIPKYSYKLFDLGEYQTATANLDTTKQNKAIEIKFGIENTEDANKEECTTLMESGERGECNPGDWMTHPAFLAFNTNGFWVGKFETSNSSGITIKPNKSAYTNISIATMFNTSKNYKSQLDSHMMKNTEWGAVAYLTQSIYGMCKDYNHCSEVRINNSSNYITGFAAKTSPNTGYDGYKDYGIVSPNTDNSKSLAYPNSSLASTTGNNTGIFDMSGGAWEYTMGYMSGKVGNSGLTESGILTTANAKYFDKYLNTTENEYNKRILGDATGELGPFGQSNQQRKISEWYNDEAYFLDNSRPWFIRGGSSMYGMGAGIFTFHRYTGGADADVSFRIVLAPLETKE